VISIKVSPEDWIAIQELISKYTYACDEDDFDSLADCYIQDAIIDLESEPRADHSIRGRDSIVMYQRNRVLGRTDIMRHLMSNPVVVSSARDTVNLKTTMTFLSTTSNGGLPSTSLVFVGVYHDVVRRESDGIWRFAERKLRRDYNYIGDAVRARQANRPKV
jgi:SnoaL-like domain